VHKEPEELLGDAWEGSACDGCRTTLTHVADGAHPAADQVSLRDLYGQPQV
jgi:hypothetical protein